MGSTLSSFNPNFYRQTSTTESGDLLSNLKELYDKTFEDVVYELFLESKAFSKMVQKTEDLLKKDPSKLPSWD